MISLNGLSQTVQGNYKPKCPITYLKHSPQGKFDHNLNYKTVEVFFHMVIIQLVPGYSGSAC